MAKASATKKIKKPQASGIEAMTGTPPLERPQLPIPANAVSFPVPAGHVVTLCDLWVNPDFHFQQTLQLSRYIQTPGADYREVLMPAHWIKGTGEIPTGNWQAAASPHPSVFVVACNHVRKVKGEPVVFGSFPAKFFRDGDTYRVEFEDIGAPPTDTRLAFRITKKNPRRS